MAYQDRATNASWDWYGVI